MSEMPLKVTVYDPETGETARTEIPPGSYMVVCAEPCYSAGSDHHANGTVQITLKGVRNAMRGALGGGQDA